MINDNTVIYQITGVINKKMPKPVSPENWIHIFILTDTPVFQFIRFFYYSLICFLIFPTSYFLKFKLLLITLYTVTQITICFYIFIILLEMVKLHIFFKFFIFIVILILLLLLLHSVRRAQTWSLMKKRVMKIVWPRPITRNSTKKWKENWDF